MEEVRKKLEERKRLLKAKHEARRIEKKRKPKTQEELLILAPGEKIIHEPLKPLRKPGATKVSPSLKSPERVTKELVIQREKRSS